MALFLTHHQKRPLFISVDVQVSGELLSHLLAGEIRIRFIDERDEQVHLVEQMDAKQSFLQGLFIQYLHQVLDMNVNDDASSDEEALESFFDH